MGGGVQFEFNSIGIQFEALYSRGGKSPASSSSVRVQFKFITFSGGGGEFGFSSSSTHGLTLFFLRGWEVVQFEVQVPTNSKIAMCLWVSQRLASWTLGCHLL